jgi:hypothetical protein
MQMDANVQYKSFERQNMVLKQRKKNKVLNNHPKSSLEIIYFSLYSFI